MQCVKLRLEHEAQVMHSDKANKLDVKINTTAKQTACTCNVNSINVATAQSADNHFVHKSYDYNNNSKSNVLVSVANNNKSNELVQYIDFSDIPATTSQSVLNYARAVGVKITDD